MDAKFFNGRAGGFPLRGRLVNIDSGDASKVIKVATKVAKAALVVGGGALIGATILKYVRGGGLPFSRHSSDNSFVYDSEPSADDLEPENIKQIKLAAGKFKRELRQMLCIDELCAVKTDGQMFYGICDSENLKFICEKKPISLPTKMIKLVMKGDRGNTITLFDGSTYLIDTNLPVSCDHQIISLTFLTVAGRHQLEIGGNLHFIKGVLPVNIEELSKNLSAFLAQKESDIISLLGEEGLMRILEECEIDPQQKRLAGSSDKKNQKNRAGDNAPVKNDQADKSSPANKDEISATVSANAPENSSTTFPKSKAIGKPAFKNMPSKELIESVGIRIRSCLWKIKILRFEKNQLMLTKKNLMDHSTPFPEARERMVIRIEESLKKREEKIIKIETTAESYRKMLQVNPVA